MQGSKGSEGSPAHQRGGRSERRRRPAKGGRQLGLRSGRVGGQYKTTGGAQRGDDFGAGVGTGFPSEGPPPPLQNGPSPSEMQCLWRARTSVAPDRRAPGGEGGGGGEGQAAWHGRGTASPEGEGGLAADARHPLRDPSAA